MGLRHSASASRHAALVLKRLDSSAGAGDDSGEDSAQEESDEDEDGASVDVVTATTRAVCAACESELLGAAAASVEASAQAAGSAAATAASASASAGDHEVQVSASWLLLRQRCMRERTAAMVHFAALLETTQDDPMAQTAVLTSLFRAMNKAADTGLTLGEAARQPVHSLVVSSLRVLRSAPPLTVTAVCMCVCVVLVDSGCHCGRRCGKTASPPPRVKCFEGLCELYTLALRQTMQH